MASESRRFPECITLDYHPGLFILLLTHGVVKCILMEVYKRSIAVSIEVTY